MMHPEVHLYLMMAKILCKRLLTQRTEELSGGKYLVRPSSLIGIDHGMIQLFLEFWWQTDEGLVDCLYARSGILEGNTI